MDETTREVMRGIMKSFGTISYLRPEDIPEIPLYMDQITTLMDGKLASCKRHPEDKILTKTMINNYTKNKLIPPPEKKKYSRDHLILMIFTYYLKDFMSISDIGTILKPLEEHYFQNEDGPDMQSLYSDIYDLMLGRKNAMTKDLLERLKTAEKAFPEEMRQDDPYLVIFSFICLLSFDVYVKKHLIEAAVDSLNTITEERAEKEKQAAENGKRAAKQKPEKGSGNTDSEKEK